MFLSKCVLVYPCLCVSVTDKSCLIIFFISGLICDKYVCVYVLACAACARVLSVEGRCCL